MATSSSSASSCLPPSRVTCTPVAVVSTFSERVPSSCLMPRLRNARSSSLEEVSSSSGTRWGSASTMVTSAPNARQTLANSQPIAPAPRMITEAGIVSFLRASSLVMTRSWSISMPGIARGTEPVASRTCPASMVRSPTCTAVGDTSVPWPSTTSILRLFTRPARPL